MKNIHEDFLPIKSRAQTIVQGSGGPPTFLATVTNKKFAPHFLVLSNLPADIQSGRNVILHVEIGHRELKFACSSRAAAAIRRPPFNGGSRLLEEYLL